MHGISYKICDRFIIASNKILPRTVVCVFFLISWTYVRTRQFKNESGNRGKINVTIAHQTLLSMEFSRQEYWNGLLFPSPEDLPYSGIEPGSPTLQADSLPSEPPGKPYCLFTKKTILSYEAYMFVFIWLESYKILRELKIFI